MEHINHKPTSSATFRPHQTELLFRGVASSSDHLHKHVWPKQGLNYTKEVILRAFYNQNECPPYCFSTSFTHFFPFLAGLFLVLVASCFFLRVNFLGGGSIVTAAVSSSSITTWSSRHRFLFVKKLHQNSLNYTSCNVF